MVWVRASTFLDFCTDKGERGGGRGEGTCVRPTRPAHLKVSPRKFRDHSDHGDGHAHQWSASDCPMNAKAVVVTMPDVDMWLNGCEYSHNCWPKHWLARTCA